MSDNELIAKFMGNRPFEDGRYGTMWADPTKDNRYGFGLNYGQSWDWLMPVVEKIEEIMLQVSIHTAYTNVCGELNGIKYNQDSCFESQQETKIDVTYRAVLRFIKWYNSLNPTQP